MVYLDSRSYMIFQEIIDNSTITGKGLEEKFQLTRKQLSYSFAKINDYLKENGYPEIKRLKTGYFVVPGPVIEQYAKEHITPASPIYTYSDEERIHFIGLRLLSYEGELSSYHFTDELQISKNTLLNDLKKVDETSRKFKVGLSYDRKNGYHFLGTENDERELLTFLLRKFLRMPGGEEKLIRIYEIDRNYLQELRQGIEEIEKRLSVQFADERLTELLYIFYFTLLRIKQDRRMQGMAQNHLVTTTKEYSVVAAFADRLGVKDENEIIYFTVQIQISKVHNQNYSEMGRIETIKEYGIRMLNRFESISCVQLNGREEFLEILYQHIKPAVYRIVYGFHVEPDITDMILPRYQNLHEIVRRAMRVYEEQLGCEFPDSELVYITVLFASWLQKEGKLQQIREKQRAVVVCTNGLTVSQYLFISLSELFPEIEFLDCLSLREFYEYKKNFEIVFSTVRLDTDKKQFVAMPFADVAAKKVFREHVMTDINEEKGTDVCRRGLSSLLTDNRIYIAQDMPEWQEAIWMAADTLLKEGLINDNYVKKSIEMIEIEERFIQIADGIIIVHAGVDDGVYEMGMSLLRLPKKLSFNGYMDADIVIMLATPDKTCHLPALYQLFDLLEGDGNVDIIRNAKDVHGISHLLRKYV